jgi:hypothetical protein
MLFCVCPKGCVVRVRAEGSTEAQARLTGIAQPIEWPDLDKEELVARSRVLRARAGLCLVSGLGVRADVARG